MAFEARRLPPAVLVERRAGAGPVSLPAVSASRMAWTTCWRGIAVACSTKVSMHARSAESGVGSRSWGRDPNVRDGSRSGDQIIQATPRSSLA